MNLIDFIKTRGLSKYFILGFSVIVLVLILQKLFLLVLLIGFSIAISYFIGLFQMSKSIGIELVTFTTILAGFAFGPTAGAIIGFILILTHLTIGHFAFGPYILWVIPAYVAIGILASTLTGFNLTTLGTYVVIGINILFIILTAIVFPQNLGNYVPYAVTNILFNLILFSQFGPLVTAIVK